MLRRFSPERFNKNLSFFKIFFCISSTFGHWTRIELPVEYKNNKISCSHDCMRFKLSVVMSSRSKDTIVAVQTERSSIKAYWKGKRSHSRLTWVTQERLCLSSPLCKTHLYFVRIDLSLDLKTVNSEAVIRCISCKAVETHWLCSVVYFPHYYWTILYHISCEVNNFVEICVAFNRAWITKPLMTLSPLFNKSGWYPQLPCNRTITKHTLRTDMNTVTQYQSVFLNRALSRLTSSFCLSMPGTRPFEKLLLNGKITALSPSNMSNKHFISGNKRRFPPKYIENTF